MTTTKIAIVTGGSRGLGKEMAISLANKGLNVILTYNIRKAEAESVVRQIQSIGQKAKAIQLDVAKTKTFDEFIENLSKELKETFNTTKIDFLINNAGYGHYASFPETTEQQFDDMVNVHLKSTFFLTQKLLPYLNESGGIVNISTGLTRFTSPGFAAYAAVKGAIEVLTKYQVKELGERKIRVNTVAPGAIETDFGGGLVRDNKDFNAFVASVTALGCVGLPADIAGVVAFLCTEDARWINAQRIEVSGGMNI